MGLITIIVPVSSHVNELELKAEQLESLAEDFKHYDFEYIYLDNGSNSASIEWLEDRVESDKRYRVVILTRDFGDTAQILAGTTYASGDCAILLRKVPLDPSRIIMEMIRHWESGSKVIISRQKESPRRYSDTLSVVRSKTSSILAGYMNQTTKDELRCLLIDKQVMYVFTQIVDPHRDIFEILAWTGFQTCLVEFSSQEDEGGERRFIFRDEIVSLSTDLKTPKVFRTSLSLGILVALLGVLFTIGLIFALTSYEFIMPDWWLIISSMLVVLGIQMSLTGIIGGKIHRSIEMVSEKPLFVVDTLLNPPVQSTAVGKEKLEKMILSLWSIRKRRSDFTSTSSSPASEE